VYLYVSVGVYKWFCNVWVCVCMGFVMCGCFDNCAGVFGNMCTCICCVLYCCTVSFIIFLGTFLFVTSVRTTATE